MCKLADSFFHLVFYEIRKKSPSIDISSKSVREDMLCVKDCFPLYFLNLSEGTRLLERIVGSQPMKSAALKSYFEDIHFILAWKYFRHNQHRNTR